MFTLRFVIMSLNSVPIVLLMLVSVIIMLAGQAKFIEQPLKLIAKIMGPKENHQKKPLEVYNYNVKVQLNHKVKLQ